MSMKFLLKTVLWGFAACKCWFLETKVAWIVEEKGLHRVKGCLKRVSEQETMKELLWDLPQEPSSAALLQQWVSWGHHRGRQGQCVWLCPHTSREAEGWACICSAAGAGNPSFPEAGGQAGTRPPVLCLASPGGSPSWPSLSRSTSWLSAKAAAFLDVFPWTGSLVPLRGGWREGQAKTEDRLFLGWLSPTPWKAGCQLGGVVGWLMQKGSRDLRHLSVPRDPEPV